MEQPPKRKQSGQVAGGALLEAVPDFRSELPRPVLSITLCKKQMVPLFGTIFQNTTTVYQRPANGDDPTCVCDWPRSQRPVPKRSPAPPPRSQPPHARQLAGPSAPRGSAARAASAACRSPARPCLCHLQLWYHSTSFVRPAWSKTNSPVIEFDRNASTFSADNMFSNVKDPQRYFAD